MRMKRERIIRKREFYGKTTFGRPPREYESVDILNVVLLGERTRKKIMVNGSIINIGIDNNLNRTESR